MSSARPGWFKALILDASIRDGEWFVLELEIPVLEQSYERYVHDTENARKFDRDIGTYVALDGFDMDADWRPQLDALLGCEIEVQLKRERDDPSKLRAVKLRNLVRKTPSAAMIGGADANNASFDKPVFDEEEAETTA